MTLAAAARGRSLGGMGRRRAKWGFTYRTPRVRFDRVFASLFRTLFAVLALLTLPLRWRFRELERRQRRLKIEGRGRARRRPR